LNHPRRTRACIYNARGEMLSSLRSMLRILTVHVNDQLIASNNCAALDKFKLQPNSEFECKDIGPVQHFLGFDIHRD
jgi:hypothetical protein